MKVPPKILIVEDDVNSAYVLKAILEKSGYQTLPIATDSKSAIQEAEAHHPELILMDISLGGEMDGIDTVLHIHKKWDIPVIYLTGHSSEEVIRRAKGSTPFGFILKPYTVKLVLVTVEVALHKASIEKESKETKMRLAVTLGNLLNPVFSTLPNGKITYANAAAQAFLQVPIGKILNRHIDEVLPLLTQEKQSTSFLNFLVEAKPNVNDRQAVFQAQEGLDRHVYVQVSSIRNLYHEIQGYVVALNDFTEQFYSEQKNQMLALALSNSQEGIIVVEIPVSSSDVIKILYMNHWLARFLKCDVAQSLERCDLETLGFKLNNTLLCALREHTPYASDVPWGTDTITHWSVSPFIDEKTQVYRAIITIQDVTQLRRIEENLRQTQKIEAVGRLASGIAHDFNNLLSVINGCADLSLQFSDTNPQLIGYLNSIKEAGARGAMLTQQLMLFCRSDAMGKTSLSKEELAPYEITKTLSMIKHYLRNDIVFECKVDPQLWETSVSGLHFDQILVNLCINACDAMPQGGHLNITFQNFEGCPPGLIRGNFIKICVQDTGLGMDSETQKKIFEPFFTTKPVGKGTGLGLASVYGLVKRYDGNITVESQPNTGTTFTIYFPAKVAVSPLNENALLPDRSSVRVCRLQVQPELEALLQACLLRAGWRVITDEDPLPPHVRCVYISHNVDSDIYIPLQFSPATPVQHPCAIMQVLQQAHALSQDV